MHIIELIFWICIWIVFYNYIGYGIIIGFIVLLKKLIFKQGKGISNFTPETTLVVAAFNEEDFIEEKIENCIGLDYPVNKLKFVFVTDGSTDNTPQLISKYKQIHLLHQPLREGKTAALNRAMQFVNTPITIFSDANTLLNPAAIRNIVGHYSNPVIGGVSGEKRIISSFRSDSAVEGEGIYWKYESFLKKLDSSFFTVVGAAGELFSIRTQLYEPVHPSIILDDFIISLKVVLKGYKVRYEPEAYALELPSANILEEQKRKIRISAGGFQAILQLKELLNIFKHPAPSFQYISHRVLRWTLTPLSLLIIFFTNWILLWSTKEVIFGFFLVSQMIFYCLALAGLYCSNRGIKIKLFYIPFYFTFMNIAVYLGFIRFLKKAQSSAWERSARQKFV